MEKDKTPSHDSSYYYGSISVRGVFSSGLNGARMNERVKSAIPDLVEIIKETKEYQDYNREIERVMEHVELKKQIDEFRIRNYEIQNFSKEEEILDKVEQLEAQYSQLRENPMVNDFLAAELAFCRMIQEVNLEITAAMDFDLEVRP